MKVSVVIPSLYHVDAQYLKVCVESLRATTNWDIIVVTNGTDNKPDLSGIKGITKHIHTPAQGQCIATNYGAQVVPPDTDYIMVSNSDMYYAPGWNHALKFDYPVFSPNLVEPEGHESAPPFVKFDGGQTIETFEQEEVDKFIENYALPPGDTTYEEPGFNLPFFIKKNFWDFLKGYDVNYDPWGSNSDTDLQTRINLAGVTPMRLREILVYHFGNTTPTFAPENDGFRMNNFEYFKDKFGFDRDELKSDVWYNKDMIPKDKSKIKFKQAKYEN